MNATEVSARVLSSTRLRESLFGRFRAEPSTDAYRLIHAEADGFPGIHVDAYAGYLVLNVARPEAIETAYRESENWIEQMSRAAQPELEELSKTLQDDFEPHLIQYVISELNQPLDDGVELEDEQKGEVFFVLKTVISSLGRRTV